MFLKPGSFAGLLYRDYVINVKLSCAWFKSVDRPPMNVGDRDSYPLFPFGFALTIELLNLRKLFIIFLSSCWLSC